MLWRRATEPFAGAWALPGGPLLADETLGASVARQLASARSRCGSWRTSSSWRPAATPAATRGAGRWPPPTSGWSRRTWTPRCPTTPPGTRRRPAGDRVRPRLDRRVGARPAAGQALVHQCRVRPRAADLHDRGAARHLRRRARLRGDRHQPAAGAAAPRGAGADGGDGAARAVRRAAGDALPVRVAGAGGHRPVRRPQAAVPAYSGSERPASCGVLAVSSRRACGPRRNVGLSPGGATARPPARGSTTVTTIDSTHQRPPPLRREDRRRHRRRRCRRGGRRPGHLR